MVRDIHPMGIFFVETKVDDSIVASVIHSIGFLFFKKKKIQLLWLVDVGAWPFCWHLDLIFDVLLKS